LRDPKDADIAWGNRAVFEMPSPVGGAPSTFVGQPRRLRPIVMRRYPRGRDVEWDWRLTAALSYAFADGFVFGVTSQ